MNGRRVRYLVAAAGAVAVALLGGTASAASMDPGEPGQKRRAPSRSFAWALSLADDDPEGYIAMRRMQLAGAGIDWSRVARGVFYARELAEMAWDQRQDKAIFRDVVGLDGARLDAAIEREERRRTRNLARWGVGRTPTPGERYGVETRKVLADVRYARTTLFGDVGDGQIRYRLQRFTEQMEAEPRFCVVPGCANSLPRTSRATRIRCDPCLAAGRR